MEKNEAKLFRMLRNVCPAPKDSKTDAPLEEYLGRSELNELRYVRWLDFEGEWIYYQMEIEGCIRMVRPCQIRQLTM